MAIKSSNVAARVEPEIKEQAEAILAKLGISASNGINMFYRQIILWNGLPFRPAIPEKKMTALEDMTKEEFDALMDNVARVRNSAGELDEEQLENVSGGFAITSAGVALFAAIVTAVGAAAKAAKWYIYDEPYSRGKADARAKNNKQKNKIC